MTLAAPLTSPASHSPALDTDVIVIGAGPAGMTAAIELASAGIRVVVLDLQPTPGGQIFRSIETNLAARPGTDRLLDALGPAYQWGAALVEQFRATAGIDYRPDTTVWDLRADGTVGWLTGDAAGYLRARQVVLANGAMERPMPFPGWTLPGVMTAGAIQTLMKAGHLQPEGRIVLAGTGPLILLLAEQLRRLGIKPALIARTDRLRDKIAAITHIRLPALPAMLKGLSWIARLHLGGIPMQSGIAGLKATGKSRVEAVSMTVAGKTIELPCDLLIVHDGIIPAIELAQCAGLDLDWHDADASWRPRTSDEGKATIAPGPSLTSGPCRIHVTGDARRIAGADAAIAHGRYAAKALLAELKGPAYTHIQGSARQAVRQATAGRPFLDAAFPPGLSALLPDDGAIVCRCEELTAGTLRAAIRRGATDMNLIRGISRCGMGPCQGRNCSVTLARLLAETQSETVRPPVPFRARPPIRPLPLGALADLSGIDPELAQIESLDDKPEVSLSGDAHA
jgi:NADPH-dependent 2,4-dienoyl-CoA reductase/sulfur reductase-like enzyme/bacterioferritin-associated ferredoxin